MNKVILIAGPTGVGKTSLSVALAKQFNGEIISGDAYQVYKEMSIGTAKITEEEKDGVSHYLVDEYHFDEEYNVKVFQEKGRAYIEKIISKGKVPIVCGGTGLYMKALLYDYVFESEEVDETYQNYLKSLSNEELYEMLKKIDEKSTETIHINNRKRVIRALMMAHSGTLKSERLEKQEHKPLYDAYIIGLTLDRDGLYERINKRVDIMMNMGLYDEMKSIVKNESVFSLQSMRAIGYKEWQEHFYGEKTIEEVIESIKKNSRNFAKRQYTWFKNQMDVHWYDIMDKAFKESVFKDVECFLKGESHENQTYEHVHD